jgi:hypothetical protein
LSMLEVRLPLELQAGTDKISSGSQDQNRVPKLTKYGLKKAKRDLF